jgi:hypothetical protein
MALMNNDINEISNSILDFMFLPLQALISKRGGKKQNRGACQINAQIKFAMRQLGSEPEMEEQDEEREQVDEEEELEQK